MLTRSPECPRGKVPPIPGAQEMPYELSPFLTPSHRERLCKGGPTAPEVALTSWEGKCRKDEDWEVGGLKVRLTERTESNHPSEISQEL